MDERIVAGIKSHMAWGTSDGVKNKNIPGFGSAGGNFPAHSDIGPGTSWQLHSCSLPINPADETRTVEGAWRLGTIDVRDAAVFQGSVYDLAAYAVFGSLGIGQGSKCQQQDEPRYTLHGFIIVAQESRVKATLPSLATDRLISRL
jgi:hypothetical protein